MNNLYRKRGINNVLKKCLAIILVIAMMMGTLPSGLGNINVYAETDTITPDYSWYGDGTGSNFSISSAAQLLGFANLVNGYDGMTTTTFSGITITLTADVTLTGNWLPIGHNKTRSGPNYDGPAFDGTFDGGNHTIAGVNVNVQGSNENITSYGGFFGVASSVSTIKNVKLSNPQVIVIGGKGTDISTMGAGAYAGGIVGLTEGNVINCHVVGGSVSVGCNDGGSSDVASGGIAGRIEYGATVEKCSSSAAVSSKPVSGIYADQSKIPPSHIGGIAGENRGTIINCTSSGAIENNIPVGVVYAKAFTGGIAGLNNEDISYCYFNGTVKGNTANDSEDASSSLGGIMGGSDYGSTTVLNCYYNSEKVSSAAQTVGTGLTTIELKDVNKFAGWEFTDIWIMGDEYPVLKGSKSLPIEECKCEIDTFSVAGDDHIVIPYGEESATFTLSPEIPHIDSTQCTIPGHKVSSDRDIRFTYIIKSVGSDSEDGIICDGASIDPETKIITFTKAGTYTVEVYAGDPVSLKIQKATAAFTVENEGCTCAIPDFNFPNNSVKIPNNMDTGSYTFIDPSLTLTGNCPIDGHNKTNIEYTYSVVERDPEITSASIEGNLLNVEGEGKVIVRLTASASGTGANAVSKDAEITFTKDLCGCEIHDFTFEGGNIALPLGQSTAQKIFNDPSVTNEACDIDGHDDKDIEFQYSIVPENNTAGATITGNTLTVTKNGSVTVKIRVSLPGTDALLEKTATFNVVSDNIQIPEYLKKIEIIAGNSATLGWDANFSGSLDIEIKDSDGKVVKEATVNIADRKYTVPSEVLTGLGTYTTEILVADTSTVLTAQIEVLPPKTSILLNPAPNTYYDNESSVSLSWRTSNEIAGSTITVTVKKGTAEYSNFSVQGNTVTINNVQKPESVKDTYTVSAAISYGGKVVASDRFSFDVYRTNALEIVNASSGESCTLASPLLISNVSAAGSMSESELLEKANGFNLQRSVKLKEAYSSYGDDKYQWTVADANIASISGSNDKDGYYPSNAEMKITGLKEGETTVSVKHVSTGVSTIFKVKVETLENKLYILKAPVNAEIKLQYTVGSENKEITTNANGMAAIFETYPLSGDIVVFGEASGKIYMGKTPVSKLVSGEISTATTTYPVSNINAAVSTNITVKLSAAAKETVFQFMDETITQNGKLIKGVNLSVKGYLLKNDQVIDTKTQDVKITRTDYQNVTLQFDTSGLGTVKPLDKVKFVYEITGDKNSPYAPAYASIEPASGTANFGEVPVTLQAAQNSQTAYVNSIVMSNSLNGTWEDITSRTDSLNLDDKTPVRYVKAIICWPKNQMGTVDLVNSNGDAVGASSLTTINSTITDMNYGWQEAIIKVDANLIAKGKSLRFSYKLYNTVAQKSAQIPSGFVLANMTGVKSYDMKSAIPFLGVVSSGDTKMKILGNRAFNVSLPKDIGVSYKYEFDGDPLNGRFVAILGWGGENLTSKNKEKDPAFIEAFKKAADMVKSKTKVKNSGGGLNVDVGGFLMGDIKYLKGEWTLVLTGGGIYGGAEGFYSFSQTQFLGPIPVCYGIEFKAGAELTMALDKSGITENANGSNFDQMFDLYLKLYGSIMAYGGVGFDAGFIAARIGLFGQLGLEFYFRSSFIENARRAGGQLNISGSMGIEAVLKFLFFKKRYVLCEAGFKKSITTGFDYSKYGGYGAPTFRGMRFVQQVQGVDGKLYDLYESNYMLDDRDYLSQPQLWNDGSTFKATYSMISLNEDEPALIGSNQYPYGYPMISNDGTMIAMLSDFGLPDVNDTGAAYSIKNGDGTWSTPARVYDQETPTPASNLTFDGTSSFAAAAWESTEKRVPTDNADEDVSTVDISSALAKSEIFAAMYKGTTWVTTPITKNGEADMAPAISANNEHAVVVWQRVAPSADDPMNIGTKNELWYSVYDGKDWSDERILDSGDAGNINSFSVAVATDGSSMVAANVDIDRDDATLKDREVFTYYISKDGSVIRKNLTNNDWQDGGSKVTVRKINAGNGEKEFFFTAWYSEQVDENNALLANDLKLSVSTVNGEKADGFPTSLGTGTGNFNFIKSTDTSLNSFGILWSQVSGTIETASQTLYARLLTSGDNGNIVVTSPYAITSVNPNKEEIVKFEAAAKEVDDDIQVEAVYLKNNLELEVGSDLTVFKATSADLMSASKVITEGIDIGDAEYDATGIQGGTILPITIPVHNKGLSKVKSLKIKANGQVFTMAKSILPDATVEAAIDYKVDEAVSDVTIEVTPVYANSDGDKATVLVELSKPDLSIKSVVLSGTGDGGKRVFDVNLGNEGIKSIAESQYKVQITAYEDFARRERAAIEDLSSGETIKNGRIIIADAEKLGDIDAKSGTCKIGYTVLQDAYDNNGTKTLYIDADIIDSEGEVVDEATYADNQSGISFTSPKLLYPSQFEATVIQENRDGVTNADITVRNLYPEAGKDTLRLRLLNNNQVIEEKSIPVDLNAESSMTHTIAFTKRGTGIQTAFLGDKTPDPTPDPAYPPSSGSSSQPEQTTGGSKPVDKNGQPVIEVVPKVTTEANGSITIEVKSKEALLVKQPDGTIAPFGDFSKVAITPQIVSSVTISPDGAIKVRDLSKGTHNSFNITYDLGNGQKITIGAMEIVIDADGNATVTTTLIDPYGIIIDVATGEAIAGVNVTLYYADTERNRASGKTPDTVVSLPGIPGFEPNQNKNPQISDANGAYGFMVFPETDYYIVATKEGYSTYRSMTIPVEYEIVKWDFKMNKPSTGVTRLSGTGRVDTALAIAGASYSGRLSSVILATADNYPDALAGSVLAYKLNAPILLVGNSVNDQNKVLSYVKSSLDPEGTVYILGGTSAVSSAMENKVTAVGIKNITRLSGSDRYDTSVKIADQLNVKTGTPVVLAYGENYPDVLSISSIAAQMQAPVLLVGKDGLSQGVEKKISEIMPSRVYIIGGEGVISKDVEERVTRITALTQENIVRLKGSDRYETSLAVAKYFDLAGRKVCIATGENFPDALSGSVYAANHNISIILADGSLPDEVMNYLKAKEMTGAAIFGGEAVVSKDIERQLIELTRK